MKISLIGSGRTGGVVAERLSGDPEAVLGQVFDTANPPTAQKLQGSGSDVLVIFVPGAAVADIIDPVMECGLPAVWGSTGAEWPADLQERLVQRGVSWVISPNFSIGMAWIRHCLAWFSHGGRFPETYRIAIHEIHHAAKLDRPSGTALDWRSRMAAGASIYAESTMEITSDRIGLEPGRHVLSIEGPGESMQLIHQAKDRTVFAEGAILSAKWLAKGRQAASPPAPGLHSFDDVIASLWSSPPPAVIPTR